MATTTTAAVSQPTVSGAVSTPSTQSALTPFGWRTVDGRVIHVEPMHMAKPDVRWGRMLLKLLVLGATVYYLGLLLLVLFLLLLVGGWLLGKVFSGGFVSAVAVQVTSFLLTRRLMGPTANVPVRDFRVRSASGQETLVRMKGELVSGSVGVGDDVHVEGWERNGMILFRKGFNQRIQAAIRVRPA